MARDLAPVFEHVDAVGADAYMIEAADESANQGYLSGFWAPDPFVTLAVAGEVHCLVKPLEFNRAKQESGADSVTNVVTYDFHDRLEDQERHTAWAGCIADFCADHGVSSVLVPGRFPTLLAEALEDAGMTVIPDATDVLDELRAVKTESELENIAESQAAAEAAMGAAEEALAAATIGSDDQLQYEGSVLTSERLKSIIERELLDNRCALEDTIVACGAAAADPHDRGNGPLHAHESIIIDIFPRHKEHRYFGDLTRTFVKGTPSPEIRQWYDLTYEAQTAALEAIEAGVTGESVHDAVCETYEAAGHSTLRSDPGTETGFIHSTGHGVGLAIHEQPSLAQSGGELERNHVVTVEPGLYDPAIGGVRIEDLVVVTETGLHNLTDYPKRLVIE